jgi:hypothetical protein
MRANFSFSKDAHPDRVIKSRRMKALSDLIYHYSIPLKIVAENRFNEG